MELQTLSPIEDRAIYFREFIHKLVQKFKPLQIFSFFNTLTAKMMRAVLKKKPQAISAIIAYCLLLIATPELNMRYRILQMEITTMA